MSLLIPGRNIVLIGMMGAGKTTVGRLVAERLARPFADTDELVQAETGRSIREIFATWGEREFRRLEAEAVRHVAALRGQVIAVGGGAIADPGNRTHLRATGELVLLDADDEVLAQRAGDERDERPLIAGTDVVETLRELRQVRQADYSLAANVVIDTTGRSAQEVAHAVLQWARARPGLLAREELQAL